MAKINQKHKTVGVSFNPLVRQAANRRARQLGVSFSRYVGLCVEAEIAGRVSLASLCDAQWADSGAVAWEQGVDLAESTGERLRADVGDLLLRAQVVFSRNALLGAMRADFWVGTKGAEQPPSEKSASEQQATSGEQPPSQELASGEQKSSEGMGQVASEEACALMRTPALRLEKCAIQDTTGHVPASLAQGVVIECHYPSAASHAALLGRAVMLQQMCGRQAVLLCVPYLSVFEPELHAVFARLKIGVTTPDTLLKALQQAGNGECHEPQQ